MGVAGEEAAGAMVGVRDHGVDDRRRQNPVPAQHHPYGERGLGQQVQQDLQRSGGIQRQPGEPPGGQVGVLPDLIRCRHASNPQGKTMEWAPCHRTGGS